MPKSDHFVTSLKDDMRFKGLTYADAAELAKVSLRQFSRQVKGDNKQGVMPLETVAELRKEGVISHKTAQFYLEIIKKELMLKKKRKGWNGLRTLTIKNILFR